MYLERTIQKEIPNLCKNFKVIMLSGMRQVGKSTLFSHLKESERKASEKSNWKKKSQN